MAGVQQVLLGSAVLLLSLLLLAEQLAHCPRRASWLACVQLVLLGPAVLQVALLMLAEQLLLLL